MWKVVGIIVGIILLWNVISIIAFSALSADYESGPIKGDTMEYTEMIDE